MARQNASLKLKCKGEYMKTLQINTTNSLSEVSVNFDGTMFSNAVSSPYSEHIMQTLQKTLDDAGAELSDIDAFGAVTGPGSFTGIRIGMAVLKGLVCGTNKPCVSINSFELVSYNIKSNDFIVVLDSGNADAYYAIFKDKQVAEIGFGRAENILSFAKVQGLKVYCSDAEHEKFADFTDIEKVYVQPNTLALIVSEKAKRGEFTPIEKLSPVYIKLSQAEIGLEQKMKENLSFSVATQNDANALEVIDKQCFSGTECYSAKSFLEELTEKSKHYIVAKFGELVIGYVGIQKLGDDLNLLKIAVLPQYRKLGVGFKLMELTFDFKKQNNIQNYFLEVRESNQSAIKLYQKFGFKTQNVREKYYDGNENALVMFAK